MGILYSSAQYLQINLIYFLGTKSTFKYLYQKSGNLYASSSSEKYGYHFLRDPPIYGLRGSWQAKSGANEWLKITFPERVKINGLRVVVANSLGGLKDYSFQMENLQQGMNWTEIYSESLPVGKDVDVTFSPVVGKVFRFYIFYTYGSEKVAIEDFKLGFLEG